MAIFFLNVKTIGRSSGSSAVHAAAYRAGERIRDERTGRTYDYTVRRDVIHKDIVLPSRFAHASMTWARDRASLWNAAESAESRTNSRVAREYLVVLPFELNSEQHLDLARGFARELSDRYGYAVDLAIHSPRETPGSDPRNYHAHLLATTREVTGEGLGAKTTLDFTGTKRRELGLGASVSELIFVRERWATVTNEALRAANVDARIDHRPLAEQGIDHEPKLWIPRIPYEIERQGRRSVVAERLRQEHQARMQERLERTAAHEAATRANASRIAAPLAKPSAGAQSLEDIRRQARETWLRMRRERIEDTPSGAKDRGRDDDLAR
jgi:hypothetical protein